MADTSSTAILLIIASGSKAGNHMYTVPCSCVTGWEQEHAHLCTMAGILKSVVILHRRDGGPLRCMRQVLRY